MDTSGFSKSIFNALFVCGDSIYDPISGGPSPPDHYAYTFAALAGYLLYKETGEVKYKERADFFLKLYLRFPVEKRGHIEFNKYALAEIWNVEVLDDDTLRASVIDYLNWPRWQTDATGRTSYNWYDVRILYNCLAAKLNLPGGSPTPATVLFREDLQRRQTDDGFFYDFSYPDPRKGFATPLTYHAKALFCLTRYRDISGDNSFDETLKKGLTALAGTIFSAGDAFWYGRTTGGLFGYACAVYVFASAITGGLSEPGDVISEAYSYILRGLERMVRVDGTFALNLAPDQTTRPGWDDYMYLTVYNAYAAALFALAPEIEVNQAATIIDRTVNFDIGLFINRTGNLEYALATIGQTVPGQGGFFADVRYSGMQPAIIRDDHGVIVPPPPYDSSSIASILSPRNSGFIPVLERDGEYYSPKIYFDVKICDGGIIYGEGDFVVVRPPVDDPSLPRKILRKTKRVLTNKPTVAMQVKRLKRPTVIRAIYVAEDGYILSATRLTGRGKGEYYGPGVRYLSDRGCRYAMLYPETGYLLSTVERDTAWGPATVITPTVAGNKPILLEALCWGKSKPEGIPTVLHKKLIGIVSGE